MKKELQKFFTKNIPSKQKQYEAIRMYAFEDKTIKEVAKHFRYSDGALRNIISLVKRKKIRFFENSKKGPKEPNTPPIIINKIVVIINCTFRFQLKMIAKFLTPNILSASISRVSPKIGFAEEA